MKSTIFAATLAAIATGVAAFPAPVRLTPESLALLRRTDQVQQTAQQKASWPNTNGFPVLGPLTNYCYNAYWQLFPCDANGGYVANYPNTGIANYYGAGVNWQDTTHATGATINDGTPGYLGSLGISKDGSTVYPGTQSCSNTADGQACVAK